MSMPIFMVLYNSNIITIYYNFLPICYPCIFLLFYLSSNIFKDDKSDH